LYWFGVNTDSGKSVKSVHDKTGMSVHAKTRTGVHDGPESLFTMLRNMHTLLKKINLERLKLRLRKVIREM